MKLTSLLPSAAAIALVSAAVLATTSGVQATQDQPPPQTSPAQAAPAQPSPGKPMHNFPAPTNLQVLPKDLTGAQLHEIMEGFAASLGVHCDFCHAAGAPGPNGKPRLDFAADTKPEKKIARVMIQMVGAINGDYISKTSAMDPDAMGMKVKCGTCHRGHSMPEDFVPPKPAPPPDGSTPAKDRPPEAGTEHKP